MNVWICKQNILLEKSLIRYFIENMLWKKVIWCDNEVARPRKTTSQESIREYSRSRFHKIPRSHRCELAQHLPLYTSFAARNSIHGGFELDDRPFFEYANIFWMLCNFTYEKVRRNKIDLVIFNRSPHYEGDFVLYLVAKTLGIRTLIMQQSLLPNKFFYFFNISDYGKFATSQNLFSDSASFLVRRRAEKELFYMNSRGRKNRLQWKAYQFMYPEYQLMKDVFFRAGKMHAVIRYAHKRRFLRDMARLVTRSPELTKPFIYFPLHMQPELTTSVFGGPYSDQILAIEDLCAIIPEGWRIYVKENPKQKYSMRGAEFFRRLERIQKAVYVDANFSTYRLLEASKLVATVTGTVGWEAITGGKNVVYFGNTWYEGLPGAYRFDENLDLEELAGSPVSHELLQERVQQMMMKMGTGVIYPGYEAMVSNFSSEENVRTVCESLSRILALEACE